MRDVLDDLDRWYGEGEPVAMATVVANTRTTLRLRLSRATRRAVKRALARPHRRVFVRITVRATDAAKNARTRKLRVQIVR